MPKKPVVTASEELDKETAELATTAGGEPASEGDWFEADERRGQAVDLFLQGMSKAAIARQLRVHRNTVNNWFADARFAAEAERRVREHKSTKRMRRTFSNSLIVDRVERLVHHQLGKLEKDMEEDKQLSGDELRRFRELAFDLRQHREEERKDFGDNIKRVDISGTHSHSITGDVQVVHSISNTPFKEFFQKAIADDVIDVNAIDAADGGDKSKVLLQLAEVVLADTDLLDAIEDEDKERDAASRSSEG
jgi:hypothetical protein